MTTQRRQCPMCKHMGQQPDMLMLRSARLKILKPLYPDDIQKPNQWIHKQCLASCGLLEIPEGGVFATNQIIGEKRDRDTETCNNAKRRIVESMVKQYTQMIPEVIPSTSDPEVCKRCRKIHIREKMEGTPSHSDVNAKRAHREWIIQHIAGCDTPSAPALLYLDDKLPITADSEEMTYFTHDILTSPLLEGRIAPHQLFSPNIKVDVVRDLRRMGVLHTAESCACLFLQRYASVIRDHYGGFAVMFLDVWGAFENGARPLMALSLSLRLLEPSGCMITFAVTSRHSAFQGKDALESHSEVEEEAQACIRGAGLLEWRMPHPPSLPLKYRTMQVHAWMVAECA